MQLEVNWPAVLGPLFSAQGIHKLELHELEKAVRDYAPKAVRLAPGRCREALPFHTEPVAWYPPGALVFCPHDAGSSPTPDQASVRPGAYLEYLAGDYTIQDAGSMLALALCEVKPGQWLCDTCAAPGGKSTGLLEALDGSGLLVANEAIASRLGLLELALARTGYANHLTLHADVEQLAELCSHSFDCVLVDAPCTGQTLVGRGKQSLAAFSQQQIAHSSARQQRILAAAAKLARPGGRLVYSTCSFSYAENEWIIEDFLQRHPDWKARPVEAVQAWQSPIAEGCYRVWPQRDRCAGAFAAVIEKCDSEGSNLRSQRLRPPVPKRQCRGWQPYEQMSELPEWLSEARPGQWYRKAHQLHRFDDGVPAAWIPMAVAGSHLADHKTSRWEPAYAAARLSKELLPNRESVELSDAEASRFVAGEAIHISIAAAEPQLRRNAGTAGRRDTKWRLAMWQGRQLAWTKTAGRTLKNHFPKAMRQAVLQRGGS